jgi:hypothetical protein
MLPKRERIIVSRTDSGLSECEKPTSQSPIAPTQRPHSLSFTKNLGSIFRVGGVPGVE